MFKFLKLDNSFVYGPKTKRLVSLKIETGWSDMPNVVPITMLNHTS